MLRFTALTQHYDIKPILKNINLEIPRGQLAAVIGPNGMGKSTLLAAAAGILSPQAGYVEINGLKRRASVAVEKAIREQVAYLPDRPWLPREKSGRQFILSVGSLYNINKKRLMDHTDQLLSVFQLSGCGDNPISSYSRGQQKKVALSAMLVSEAPVMLLDEPFSGGLDPSGILALKQILKRLSKSNNRTILMASPMPNLIEELADQVIILKNGEICASGTVDQLKENSDSSSSLAEVLGKILHPTSLDSINRYFEECEL